jgi:hypothetical protein
LNLIGRHLGFSLGFGGLAAASDASCGERVGFLANLFLTDVRHVGEEAPFRIRYWIA